MTLPADCHPRLPQAVELLQSLVATPSFSGDEARTADILAAWLETNDAHDIIRLHNNILVLAPGYDPARPTLMLNSHHDTVRPAASYTRDPFDAAIADGRLYGLGSNDAGASVVALACTFLDLQHRTDLGVNLLLALTAAEENMAPEGMRAVLPYLAEHGLTPDMALVGEPTGLDAAVGERGLLVLDAVAEGIAGHAARNEGVNAIYRAIDDIARLRDFAPERCSAVLGPIKVSVTMINAGTQHNVVPDRCSYVVDVRTTDAYSNEQTVALLQQCVTHSTLTPRSTRVQASLIDAAHPLVQAATACGCSTFVSPTTSDMALMHHFPSLKLGPGRSERSHRADEFILLDELDRALKLYPAIIQSL